MTQLIAALILMLTAQGEIGRAHGNHMYQCAIIGNQHDDCAPFLDGGWEVGIETLETLKEEGHEDH